jgi:DNA-binding transcriptional MocR family regulator
MSQLKTIQDENLPIWLPRLAVHGGPHFLQIADALQAAVVDGSLKPGDRLPPQRQLAAQLDVDLTTITRAYDEARRRNLLEGRGARGTYVAAPKVELTSVLDLSMNTPPPPDGVDQAGPAGHRTCRRPLLCYSDQLAPVDAASAAEPGNEWPDGAKEL